MADTAERPCRCEALERELCELQSTVARMERARDSLSARWVEVVGHEMAKRCAAELVTQMTLARWPAREETTHG